jgi:drug/metabolite transporter (DMT)-like permease
MKWGNAFNVFLGGCSYGILSTFVKIAYDKGFTPDEVIGAQYFFGALLLWMIVLCMKKTKLSFSLILKLLISGMSMALAGIFYYKSLIYLDASIAIILLFQFTWIGLIFEWVIDKKSPSKRKMVSIGILLIGSLAAVNISPTSLGNLSIYGVLWGLLAAVSFTAFIFTSGRVATEVPAMLKSMVMSTGALLITFVIFPPVFLVNGALMEGLWIWGLVLGVFGVLLPPFLFSVSMPKIGTGLGTILSASELPMAVFMSMVVLREQVTLVQWIGVGIILYGIARNVK